MVGEAGGAAAVEPLDRSVGRGLADRDLAAAPGDQPEGEQSDEGDRPQDREESAIAHRPGG